MRPATPSPGRTHGIALIAVLWIVAALAIAVTGITQAVRSEIRTVTSTRNSLQAQALGEAAITLVLQQLTVRSPRPAWALETVTYQGHSIAVEVAALNGWIDLNKADLAVLTQLYRVAGGLPEAAALQWAQTTLQARQQRSAEGALLDFDTVPDLLRLPGMDYELYARLAPLLTTDARGSGRINLQSAPLEVLALLHDGDLGAAQAMMHRRRLSDLPPDTTTLRAHLFERSSSTSYRLQAQVPLADGTQALVSRDVDIRPDSRTGLLWRPLHAYDTLRPTALP